jgi:TetR/AcrR family transcriptional repressor of nem operon
MASRGEDTKQKILDAAKGLVLERGFSATSIDEIIKSSELTKGAFFHHFPSKGELARVLLLRYADEDLSLFDRLSARADELSDDPLQRILLFLSLFEEFVENMEGPFPGCMFASYIYEGQQFSPEVHELIETSLKAWTAHYQRKLEALVAVRPPKVEVTAEQLAEMVVSLLEGAFLLARAYNDTGIIIRQSRTFRQYLRSIFED